MGLGASAGGIEALKDLFAAMPVDSAMAFVVVQHLEPTHESLMAQILGKVTGMKVVPAEDAMPVEASCVYVNPAGRYLSIESGKLVLSEPSADERIRMPIDFFLRSLSEERGGGSTCIILSGSSGADGTKGVQAVHAVGGLCIAQDPSTAQFPAMPLSAIDTGVVDYVLSPAQMPAFLLAHEPSTGRGDESRGGDPSGLDAPTVESILEFLGTSVGVDFRHYKRATISRRIRRRMEIRKSPGISEYRALLEEDPGEVARLRSDMLIRVSSFFRDPAAFEALRSEFIAPLVDRRPPGAVLRAWVPGCATGEEAYSIAMLLIEAVELAGGSRQIQVFASDVDELALGIARAGVYAESVTDDVTAGRLKRFFRKQGDRYRVEKHLRDVVVFSRQDIIADPPLSKLDLISCRNVLIYIEPAVQRTIISLFGFALNQGGGLFLGKSEGVTGVGGLFEPISKDARIYRLVGAGPRIVAAFPALAARRTPGLSEPTVEPAPLAASLRQANQDVLLKHFNASVVLVDPLGEVLHFFGQTEKYLGHPKGLASLNLLDMTAGILSVKLRRAMEQVLQHGHAVSIRQVPIPREGNPLANLTVMRVPATSDGGVILGVIFEDAGESSPGGQATPVSAADETLVAQLEAEVKALRNERRADAEDFDAANEESKAANEEVMSMNEELQSAIEELEASKEELQAVNEELSTVNSQLGEKVTELTSTNNDLADLVSATDIATVFLNTQLRIMRFTDRATELLNLIPSDIGRPISDITQNFDGKKLATESERLLKSLTAVDEEVQTRDGRWHTMRILPYRTVDDRIEGVVITFSDVTRLKQVEKEARELEGRVLQAQKLESLGVMAGGIAHDFNNILAGVLGYEELALLDLEQNGLSGEGLVREYIENARKCTLLASELTGQILAYSGRGIFELQRVDLNSIIRELGALLSASISKTLSLDYRLAGVLPAIDADTTRLTQVLLNLVINASEAMGDREGTVTIKTSALHASQADIDESFPESELAAGDYVLLEVSDTGCGMDETTKARVFDPFFTTKFVGRGLGLSVVAGIIASHNGAVAFESAPGCGSVFKVILPACVAAAPPEKEAEESAPPIEGSGTILVVDDQVSVRDVTAAFLVKMGYSTLLARGGGEALTVFEEHQAEIVAVLLDVTMPGMGTEEVLEKLHMIQSDVVVLLCSGYSQHEISSQFAGKGVAGFLGKPFTMKALASKIAECIRGRVLD